MGVESIDIEKKELTTLEPFTLFVMNVIPHFFKIMRILLI